jgi:hypothetical protein
MEKSDRSNKYAVCISFKLLYVLKEVRLVSTQSSKNVIKFKTCLTEQDISCVIKKLGNNQLDGIRNI